MRRLRVCLGVLVLLLAAALPSIAWAQISAGPLSNCKNPRGVVYLEGGGNDKAGRLAGGIDFACDDTTVYADEISWDEKKMYGNGHVAVVQDGFRVFADRMEMDRETHLGIFFHAHGTARLSDRAPEKNMFGTLEPEVSFYADKIEKIGPRTYRMTAGWFSTCAQAVPRWEIRGTSGTITLNERVLLKNPILKVKGVPVLYLPVIYYPLTQDDRSTGLLIPTYSSSTVMGHGISNAYFLALSRSQDATLYYDYSSRAGQGYGAEYRFASAPGSNGNANVYTRQSAHVTDGVVERTTKGYFRIDGMVNQRAGRHFRLIGRANYFSDASTQQLYQQNPYDYSRRDRYLSADLTGQYRRGRVSAQIEQRDIFQGLTSASRTGRLPKASLWMNDQLLGKSRIYVGLNGEIANIRNQANVDDPATSTGLWRFDTTPTIRAPLSRLAFLSATTSASWRFTHWTDSLDPLTGKPGASSLSRGLFQIRADLVGPVFQKIVQTPKNGYASGFKHQIEPRIGYSWLSSFDRQDRVIANDPSVDRVPTGNATLNYGLYNRVLAKVKQAGNIGAMRSLFEIGVSQNYYTRPAVSTLDQEYRTATIGSFSPVQITALSNPADSLTAHFQMFLDAKTLSPTSYSASTTISKQTLQLSAGWSQQRFLPDVLGFNDPNVATHYITTRLSLRTHDGRVGGNYGYNFDLKHKKFVDQRFGIFYNAQCCGVSADYQIVGISHLGLGIQQDRRFNFSFTLAGIGSFSNPMGAFGNNTGVR